MSDVCSNFISVINKVLYFPFSSLFVLCVGQDDYMSYIYKIQIANRWGKIGRRVELMLL